MRRAPARCLPLLAAAGCPALAGAVDCGGGAQAVNCYSCVAGARKQSSSDSGAWERACGGVCRWSPKLGCINAPAGARPAPRQGRAAAGAGWVDPPPGVDSAVLTGRPNETQDRVARLRSVLRRLQFPPTPPPAPRPAVRRSPPPPPGAEQYFLVGFIEQQLASATSLGLHQVLRTAVALGRTAVLPRARFDEPSYRSTLQDGYFSVSKFYDQEHMLAPWSCARISTYGHFLRESARLKDAKKIQNEIDIVAIVDPKRNASAGVQRKCNPELLEQINTAQPASTFRRGVSKVDKVVDTIGGVVTVGDVVCVPQRAAAAQLRSAFSKARAVMLLTPDDRFLESPWSSVCGGIPDHVRFKPPIAQPWVALGERLVRERFGGGPFACVHIRMEKLIRHAYLAKKIAWQWVDDETVRAPYLDTCVANIQQLVAGALRAAGASAGSKRFLITDMQSEFGSVTEHVDTKEDLAGYRAWLPTAEKRIRGAGDEGFCGTAQHRRLVADEERTPRGGPVILRFGGGSFSNFATAEKGDQYESCGAVSDALAELRRTRQSAAR
eukprot:TRINITY_DN35290_c0_g1_i1.p1 TRINITY_DN35290_c0_g1~~TRINITY_DN35290_c0_g1_i1.p1  ORF type:complete len:553 (+),score=160.51 TRINITY_DN35290_c0_g1_i1:92-1750(+)